LEHARQLGVTDEKLYAELERLLAFTANEDRTVDELLNAAMALGKANFAITVALEAAHKKHFGAMEPTVVNTNAVKGKCILVSGHDMRDLQLVLAATAGKGINVVRTSGATRSWESARLSQWFYFRVTHWCVCVRAFVDGNSTRTVRCCLATRIPS